MDRDCADLLVDTQAGRLLAGKGRGGWRSAVPRRSRTVDHRILETFISADLGAYVAPEVLPRSVFVRSAGLVDSSAAPGLVL
jgi:hypothetical protein